MLQNKFLVRPDGVLKATVKNSQDELFLATYSHFKVIGHGSFGAVFLVQQKIETIQQETDESSRSPLSISIVAIKMVYQDKRYKVHFTLFLIFCLESRTSDYEVCFTPKYYFL